MATTEAVLQKEIPEVKEDSKQSCKIYWSSVLGGALLVTGTCIGAGMLGLPVKTAAAGFYPTLGLFAGIWAMMTFTALIFLEVSLFFQGQTNLISMADKTIGKWGKRVAWITYLAFLYSLMAAYTSGGTTMLADAIGVSVNHPLALIVMTACFACPFIVMVYTGAQCVDYVNRALILGLVAAFSVMTFIVFQRSNVQMHTFNAVGQSKYLLFSIPLLVTSFGYHLLIPTLKSYLNEDIRKLRLAIILGGAIPFAIYMFWEYVVLSFVPTWGDGGLVQMLHGTANPGELLVQALGGNHSAIALSVMLFSFFALTSSFIGVALGLFDFFSDGLHISKTPKGKLLLAFLTFCPPILFTLAIPQGFLLALGYAGIFAAVLLVIYPAIMAWYGRYVKRIQAPYRVAGGKPALFLAILFGLVVIVSEIFSQLGIFPVP